MLKLSLKAQISLGFGVIIILAIIMGGVGHFFMGMVSEELDHEASFTMPIEEVTSIMDQEAKNIVAAVTAFLAYNDFNDLQAAQNSVAVLSAANSQLEELQRQFPQQTAAIGKDAQSRLQAIALLGEDLRKMEVITRRNDASRANVLATSSQSIALLQEINSFMLELMNRELASGQYDRLQRRLVRKGFSENGVYLLESSVKEFLRGIVERDYEIISGLRPPLQELLRVVDEDIRPGTIQPRNIELLAKLSENLKILLQDMDLFVADNLALQDIIAAIHRETDNALKYIANVYDFARDVKLRSARDLVSAVDSGKSYIVTITAVMFLLALFIAWRISNMISRPVRAVTQAFNLLAEKNFQTQFDQRLLQRGDEMGILVRDLNEVCEELSRTIGQIAEEFAVVKRSAAALKGSNDDLNQRTQEQAAAVQEIASSITQMAGSVRDSSVHSQHANELASKTSQAAQNGGDVLARTITAMHDVTDSSRKINDIITVVNEIAFQTNLLALNAAVEAARAGEAGRGFAVVAGEVRSLAGRSASAAKEIQSLITDSVNKIEHGNRLVEESGSLLSEIISAAKSVVETIAEISAAAKEQLTTIEGINSAVNQMDAGVQHNAALVEEIASATEELSLVADNSMEQISGFITREQHGTAAAPSLLEH
jgi:methyl-accepting chemotaxis protein